MNNEWTWFYEPLFEPHEVKKWHNSSYPRAQKPDFEGINPGGCQPIKVEKMEKIRQVVSTEAHEKHQPQRAIVCFRVTYQRTLDRARYIR
jgi:hypothetical protein